MDLERARIKWLATHLGTVVGAESSTIKLVVLADGRTVRATLKATGDVIWEVNAIEACADVYRDFEKDGRGFGDFYFGPGVVTDLRFGRGDGLVHAGFDLDALITHRVPANDFEGGFGAALSGQAGKVVMAW